jgi:hypothetical protein
VTQPRRRGPSLVALLAAAVAFELGLHRLLQPILHAELLTPAGRLRDLADAASTLSHYFAATLGAFVAAIAIGGWVAGLFPVPRGARTAVGAVSVAFIPLVLLGVLRPLGDLLSVYLQASATCLVALIMLAGFVTGRSARAKLGLFVVALPVGIHLFWHLVARVGTPAMLEHARFALWLCEVATVAAAAAVLPSFWPRGTSPWLPATAGALVAVAGAALCLGDWSTAARLAAAFGLELPMAVAGRILYCVAAGLFAATVAALVSRPGPARLRGYGLALVGLAGIQLEQPEHLTALVVGYLCMVRSLLPLATESAAGWRARVQKVAALLGATQVDLAGPEGFETARVRLARGDLPLEVALGRESGELAFAEVVVGTAPSLEAPPVALSRRGTPRLGRTRGDEVATGDVAFDEAFRIWDARQLTDRDRVLDDDLRPRLLEALHGWLAIWPGRGVRYRTREVGPLADGDRLEPLIAVLSEVRSRG